MRLTSLLRSILVLGAVALLCSASDAAFARGGKKKGDDDPVTTTFVEKYRSADANVRIEAVEGLAGAPDALKISLLAKYVVPKEDRADVMARAVTVLQRVKDDEAIASIVRRAEIGKIDQRLVFIEALARHKGNTSHHALFEMLKDKDAKVRGMAAYALGEHRSIDALEPLLSMLEDPFWQVRSAAISAVRRLDDKEQLRAIAVPRLVDFMEVSSGRMQHDAADALARITGRRLGRSVKKWRAFLAGKPQPTEGDSGDAETPSSGGAYGNQATRPKFYGMEVVSNRVVLVLDFSLSMNDPIEIDMDRLRRETSRRKAAVTGGDGKKKDDDDENRQYDIPWWRIKTRLDLAREQSILLISQLREEQYFDIIFYSTEVDTWMGKLVPATSANKQKAITKLKTVKPDDKTNTWGALARAFDLAGNQKKSYKEGPDELYLVTDGMPSAGDIIEPDQLVEAVLQLHRVVPIRINIIGIGVNRRFMRKLCQATGGEGKFFTK